MKDIHRLRVGDSIAVSGVVTVMKCGMHSEGDEQPVPTVTLEVEGSAEPEEKKPHPKKKH